MTQVIELPSLYICAAIDSFSVAQAAQIIPYDMVGDDLSLPEGFDEGLKLAMGRPLERRTYDTSERRGDLPKQVVESVKLYKMVLENYKAQGRKGALRLAAAAAELVHALVNTRLLDHAIMLPEGLGTKFSRDLGTAIGRLPYMLEQVFPYVPFQEVGVIKMMEDHMQINMPAFAEAYVRGNGHAANPAVLSSCYQSACQTIVNVLAGISGYSGTSR